MLKDAAKLAEADLICDRKGRWRLFVSAHFTDTPASEPTGVIGVDLWNLEKNTLDNGLKTLTCRKRVPAISHA